MKILFFVHRLDGTDGWSRYGRDLAGEIGRQGHEVLCLVHKKTGSSEFKEKDVLGQPLGYIANPLAAYKLARRIRLVVKEFDPDIVHFIVEPYATVLPFLRLVHAKAILTIHGTYAVAPLLFFGLKRRLAFGLARVYYYKVNKVISVSEYTRKHALKYFPSLAEKITVITNGVNLENFSAVALEKTRNSPVKNILFVGTIRPRKGILEAIAALDYYAKHYNQDFVYNIIGDYEADQDYYQAVKAKIAEAGLVDRIFFRGRVSEAELAKYYQEADLFLMLPRNDGIAFEGFGLVYLEANAYGAPCVGAIGSGAAEAIADGRTGYSVEPGDYSKAAEKIDLVLNKKTIQRQACLDWATENDIKNKVEEILALYQSQFG